MRKTARRNGSLEDRFREVEAASRASGAYDLFVELDAIEAAIRKGGAAKKAAQSPETVVRVARIMDKAHRLRTKMFGLPGKPTVKGDKSLAYRVLDTLAVIGSPTAKKLVKLISEKDPWEDIRGMARATLKLGGVPTESGLYGRFR